MYDLRFDGSRDVEAAAGSSASGLELGSPARPLYDGRIIVRPGDPNYGD